MAIKNYNEALTDFAPYVPKMKLQGTYTSSQTVTLPAGTQYVFALVIGGGGGGQSNASTYGSGGGAGGINWGLFPTFGMSSLNITVGAGGTGGASGGTNSGNKGGDSSAGGIIAGGGGGGVTGPSSTSGSRMAFYGGANKPINYLNSYTSLDLPSMWGFPNAINCSKGTGLGDLFWQWGTGAAGATYLHTDSTFNQVTANTNPLIGNGGGLGVTTNAIGAGESSQYYTGGATASGSGGGAGWLANGSASSGTTGGNGGNGGGGGGGSGAAGQAGTGGAGYIELYW